MREFGDGWKARRATGILAHGSQPNIRRKLKMTSSLTVRASEGVAFEDGPDQGRILVFGRETEGRYGMMELTLAPRPVAVGPVKLGPHRHDHIEETFLVQSGTLRFLLGEAVFDLSAGDFVRVPPGVRHGLANAGDVPVRLLVSFVPGGFEELFLTHRSDQEPPPPPNGLIEAARRDFASEFEDD
jgi:quercetin dioxygenase-like cupin family protein